jgi:hypothetical protein
MPVKTEGWGQVFRSVKWHYFGADRLALCSGARLLLDQPLVQGNNDSPDNCVRCMKLRAKANKGAKQ